MSLDTTTAVARVSPLAFHNPCTNQQLESGLPPLRGSSSLPALRLSQRAAFTLRSSAKNANSSTLWKSRKPNDRCNASCWEGRGAALEEREERMQLSVREIRASMRVLEKHDAELERKLATQLRRHMEPREMRSKFGISQVHKETTDEPREEFGERQNKELAGNRGSVARPYRRFHNLYSVESSPKHLPPTYAQVKLSTKALQSIIFCV